MTRDQQRAQFAYECIGRVSEPRDQKNYKIALLALGANVLRSGLVAAIADLQRRDDRGSLVMRHLAEANIPHLVLAPGDVKTTLPAAIRSLSTTEYMLVTREMLQVVLWLKRAVQATFPPEKTEKEERLDAQKH